MARTPKRSTWMVAPEAYLFQEKQGDVTVDDGCFGVSAQLVTERELIKTGLVHRVTWPAWHLLKMYSDWESKLCTYTNQHVGLTRTLEE